MAFSGLYDFKTGAAVSRENRLRRLGLEHLANDEEALQAELERRFVADLERKKQGEERRKQIRKEYLAKFRQEQGAKNSVQGHDASGE